jgi:ribonuclease Z
MKLTFLGTGCMIPTKTRNVQGIFAKYKNYGVLFDCGEGTQRQMNIAGIKRTDINIILISHWHADHVGGLLPLVKTLGNSEIDTKFKIFGPKNSKTMMQHLEKSTHTDTKINYTLIEVDNPKPKIIYENDNFKIVAANLDHKVPCIGFTFIEKDKYNINLKKAEKFGLKEGPILGKLLREQQITYKGKRVNIEDVATLKKGKKFAVILDTSPCQNTIELSKDTDIAIIEATLHSNLEEKAREKHHLTSKDAALIANEANVKQLYLTHFSQRYKDISILREEAKTYFKNTIIAEDFMSVKL